MISDSSGMSQGEKLSSQDEAWFEGEPCPRCGRRALRIVDGECPRCVKEGIAKGSRDIERVYKLKDLRRRMRGGRERGSN